MMIFNEYTCDECDVYIFINNDCSGEPYSIQEFSKQIKIKDLIENGEYEFCFYLKNIIGESNKSSFKDTIYTKRFIVIDNITESYNWINVGWRLVGLNDANYSVNYITKDIETNFDGYINKSVYTNITNLYEGYYYNLTFDITNEYYSINKTISSKTLINIVDLNYDIKEYYFTNEEVIIIPYFEITTNNYNLSINENINECIKFDNKSGEILINCNEEIKEKYKIKLETILYSKEIEIEIKILNKILYKYKKYNIYENGEIIINPIYFNNLNTKLLSSLPSCLFFNENGIINGNCTNEIIYNKYKLLIYNNENIYNESEIILEIIDKSKEYYIKSNINEISIINGIETTIKYKLYNKLFNPIIIENNELLKLNQIESNESNESNENELKYKLIIYINNNIYKYENISINNEIEFKILLNDYGYLNKIYLLKDNEILKIEYKEIIGNIIECKRKDINEECCSNEIDICGKCNGNNECEMKIELLINGILNENDYINEIDEINEEILNEEILNILNEKLSEKMKISEILLTNIKNEIPNLKYKLNLKISELNIENLNINSNNIYDIIPKEISEILNTTFRDCVIDINNITVITDETTTTPNIIILNDSLSKSTIVYFFNFRQQLFVVFY